MSKPSDKLTAREFVWEHRLRQRIILERIILEVGTPGQKSRAKQFLEAMGEANPYLLEDVEQYTLDLFGGSHPSTPELFDHSEYSPAKGRKTALKLPKDILWEERVIRRAAREYRDLFHPCENLFKNAMQGLQYLYNLHPKLFSRAKGQAIESRDKILSFEIYCKCNCTTAEDRLPADSFKMTSKGRFEAVSKRITLARQALNDDNLQDYWHFFLDRIREVSPEMLQE